MTQLIKKSNQLIYQSIKIVRHQKKLIIFPLISSIIILLLFSLIITPIITYEKTQIEIYKNQYHIIIWAYILILLFLFIVHQITFYFNAAFIHCVNQYFKKKPVLLMEGIKASNTHFFKLYSWNLYASTVGIMINLFQAMLQGFTFYKQIFQGLSWIIATYLVIPIIMTHKTGPIKSIKHSAKLIRNTWGYNLKTNFGSLPFLLLARFLALLPLIIGLINGNHKNIIIGMAITLLLIVFTTVVNSIANTVLASALYLYASKISIAPDFNELLIKNAFVKKSTKND